METAFYPVVTVENEEELEMLTGYCDDKGIDIQFLDEDLDSFPTQVLMYIDEDDYRLFLDSLNRE